MKFSRLEPGHLLERENRFRARVALNGRTVLAHVADPGRLRELMVRGRRLWLAEASNAKRVTSHDVVLVEHQGQLVCINTRYPNDLVQEALESGFISVGAMSSLRREVTLGHSRFDFMLTMDDGHPFWVEVKAVSLVRKGVALFPDAPTVRGARHVRELCEIAQAGGKAGVVFVIQRTDAELFKPNRDMDPDFSQALNDAAQAGVSIQAFACQVSTRSMRITRSVDISLVS